MIAGALAVYFFCDPSSTEWMPRCPSKMITSYECPACGAQRALHAALHFDIRGVWHSNPFLFVGVPYLLLAVWGSLRFLPGHERARRMACKPFMVYGYIALFFAWWIIRNLWPEISHP